MAVLRGYLGLAISGFIIWVTPCIARAADDVSLAGRVKLSGDYAFDRQSVKEDPSLTARLVFDGRQDAWLLHSQVEGSWEIPGDDDRQGIAFKRFNAVYQDESRFLELKELVVERQLGGIDWRFGVQRFAWGRLDEYPINDLFNPWDYGKFLVKPMEERKIGVPALSAALGRQDWTSQLVWVPWYIPYRLPEPGSRWSVTPAITTITAGHNSIVENTPQEEDLPARTLDNGSIGFRVQRLGEIEAAVNFFHGFDPRPVFRTTSLTVTESAAGWVASPGYVPSFHKITAIGLDAATVAGPFSLRGEAAYTGNRVFNVRQELWRYPETQSQGVTPLNPIEIDSDTLDYGIAADYRPFEDGLLTVQAQQTMILDRPDTLYERRVETLIWASLKVGWLNQKVETSLSLASNPEHGADMVKAGAMYIFSDSWKAEITAIFLSGPPQSLFGRYAANDQIGLEVVYQW